MNGYHCAGCGKPFEGESKQCDCATMVGVRRSDGHQIFSQEGIDLEALRKREVQMMGAALSTRNWHNMENAYNQLRDKIDAELGRRFRVSRHSAEPAASAWIVGNGNRTRWRRWIDGTPTWIASRDHATRYTRREDAEAVHAEDEDAWRVEQFAESEKSPAEPVSQDMRYKPAWDAISKPLSWMHDCKGLRGYWGINLADVANDLIDKAYPGLRDGTSEIVIARDDHAEPAGMMDAAWDAYQNTGIDLCADSDDETRKCVENAVRAALRHTEPAGEEPVAFVCEADLRALATKPDGDDMSISPVPRPEIGIKMPLYARPATPTNPERLVEALRLVEQTAETHYTARNGRRCSIEGSDGEVCSIIPFDTMEEVRAALSAAPLKEGSHDA